MSNSDYAKLIVSMTSLHTAKFQYLSDSVLYVMTESDEAAEH